MTDISVSLTSSQAEKMLPLLQKVRGGAKGEERKIIDGLLRKLSPQIQQANEMAEIQAEQNRCMEEVESLTKIVLDTLPSLKRRGLSAEVVGYINAVDKIFKRADEDFQAANKAYLATLPKANRSSADLPADLFIKALAPTRRKLEKATENFKASGNTPLEASESYTLAAKRQTLAKKCLGTGISQAENAVDWNEIEMVALCFSDMNTHVQLGVALLSGNTTRIDEASSMDTGCRDGVDWKVWEMVTDGLDTIKRVSRSGPRR